MELAITKLRYRHCIYGDNEVQALRQVLIVQEVEVRDRLSSSNVNQFLYLYSSPARPHFANEPMLRKLLLFFEQFISGRCLKERCDAVSNA